MEDIANHPNVEVKGFKKDVKKKFKILCSTWQVYRAKKMVTKTIQGEYSQQYERLRDYCATIIQKNPGSTACIVTDRFPMYQNPIFKRMFISFFAQKEGFVSACRPVIGLDACHLKGPMDGQLMAAVGRDANNQMFPIAMALVESECKETWAWFLDVLTDAIGTLFEKGWIFLSDRQKVGILLSSSFIFISSIIQWNRLLFLISYELIYF